MCDFVSHQTLMRGAPVVTWISKSGDAGAVEGGFSDKLKRFPSKGEITSQRGHIETCSVVSIQTLFQVFRAVMSGRGDLLSEEIRIRPNMRLDIFLLIENLSL